MASFSNLLPLKSLYYACITQTFLRRILKKQPHQNLYLKLTNYLEKNFNYAK